MHCTMSSCFISGNDLTFLQRPRINHVLTDDKRIPTGVIYLLEGITTSLVCFRFPKLGNNLWTGLKFTVQRQNEISTPFLHKTPSSAHDSVATLD